MVRAIAWLKAHPGQGLSLTVRDDELVLRTGEGEEVATHEPVQFAEERWMFLSAYPNGRVLENWNNGVLENWEFRSFRRRHRRPRW